MSSPQGPPAHYLVHSERNFINRLSVELLSNILLVAWDRKWLQAPLHEVGEVYGKRLDVEALDYERAVRRRRKLCTVCNHWRNLIAKTAAFWTAVPTDYTAKKIESWLRKSKGALLDIGFMRPGRRPVDQEAMAALRAARPRWGSLFLPKNGPDNLLVWGLTLPHLHTLVCPSYLSNPFVLPVAPALVHLELKLNMSGALAAKMVKVIQVLSDATGLECLALALEDDGWGRLGNLIPTGPVVLNQLRSISICTNIRGCIPILQQVIKAEGLREVQAQFNRESLDRHTDWEFPKGDPYRHDHSLKTTDLREADAIVDLILPSRVLSQCISLFVLWCGGCLRLKGYAVSQGGPVVADGPVRLILDVCISLRRGSGGPDRVHKLLEAFQGRLTFETAKPSRLCSKLRIWKLPTLVKFRICHAHLREYRCHESVSDLTQMGSVVPASAEFVVPARYIKALKDPEDVAARMSAVRPVTFEE